MLMNSRTFSGIAWSPAPHFGTPIGAVSSASLLALGNRKGQIQLWRYADRQALLELDAERVLE